MASLSAGAKAVEKAATKAAPAKLAAAAKTVAKAVAPASKETTSKTMRVSPKLAASIDMGTSSSSKGFTKTASTPTKTAAQKQAVTAATKDKNLRGPSVKTPGRAATWSQPDSSGRTKQTDLDLLSALNAPYERRAERAGGAPFEGGIDWAGINAALFGGETAEQRDAALYDSRNPRVADPSRFDPIGMTPSWEQFDDYVNNTDAFGARTVYDPESGFEKDPLTGSYYPPGKVPRLPITPGPGPMQIAEAPGLNPLEGLKQGIDAERRRLAACHRERNLVPRDEIGSRVPEQAGRVEPVGKLLVAPAFLERLFE